MPPIGLPLLHEEDVEGTVASVFVDIRARMPFVPALFKALAKDPEILVPAWLQARAVYDDARSTAAADEIRRSAQVRIGFQPSRRVSEVVAPFVVELPFMLLIVTSLQLSLHGEFARRPPPEQRHRRSPQVHPAVPPGQHRPAHRPRLAVQSQGWHHPKR